MRSTFAATLLLGSAIASLTREQIAKLQKTQMQSCVSRVDFLSPESYRQIEDCATFAKQALSRNRTDKPRMPFAQTNLGPGSQLVPGHNISGAPHPVALPFITVGENCCIFYDGVMTGDYKEFCHDGELTDINLRDHGFANKIDSISCGRNTHVKLCDHDCDTDPDVDYQTLAGQNFLNLVTEDALHRWLQNKISVVQLQPYDEELLGAVNLFGWKDCTGKTGAMFYMDQNGGGQYGDQDIFDSGLSFFWPSGNHHPMNSMKVPPGYQVTLFEGYTLNGVSKTYTNRSYEGDSICVDIAADCYDGGIFESIYSLHSLRIDRIPHVSAIGYWKPITSGESTEFTYSVGITSSTSDSATRSNSHDFTASLTAGISFQGSGVSSTISSSHSQTETSEIMSQYGMSTMTTITTSCTAEGNEGAGLWQWVVATEDYAYQALSSQTVCRTGDIYNVSPACPWFACLGGDCAECRPVEEW